MRSATLLFEPLILLLLLVAFEGVAVETSDDSDAVDLLGSHFVSIVRSFGDAHFILATFLTGSLLFRFDALFSGFFACLSSTAAAAAAAATEMAGNVVFMLFDDDDTDGRTDDALVVVVAVVVVAVDAVAAAVEAFAVDAVVGDNLLESLSLDKFVVESTVLGFCSIFGIFGNCTKGESVRGFR